MNPSSELLVADAWLLLACAMHFRHPALKAPGLPYQVQQAAACLSHLPVCEMCLGELELISLPFICNNGSKLLITLLWHLPACVMRPAGFKTNL